MAATSSTTYASAIRTLYLKKLVKTASGMLVASRWANTKTIGRGEGDTVRFNKILRPAKVTAAATPGTLITPSDATALTSNYFEFGIENWGDSFGFNEDVSVTSFIQDKDNRETIANQMARSLDYQIMAKLATQGIRFRIDGDTDYQKSGTCTGTPTTTALISTGLDETTDDFWAGGFATVTNPAGPNYDLTRQVSAFAESTDTATTAAFPQASTTASKYWIAVGTGIVATDKLTTDGLLLSMARHEKFETERFDGGMLRMFIDADQHRDLWTDETFKNSAIHDSSERFKNYRLGRWWDTEFLASSEMYREDVDGTENQSTGVVYVATLFGKNSYSISSFANPGGSGKFGMKFQIVDTPDSQNLRNSAHWISWKSMWAGGVTRATSVHGLMTGATDIGVIV